jgi:phosphoglycolate phosphatase-like HAD superfamily hydrolase
VLDFDGVIFDSARESFTVARRSYLDLRPDSSLARRSKADLYGAFVELMPLGNRAEDYGTELAAIDTGERLPDQEAYNKFRASQDPQWLEAYHSQFYAVRHSMAEETPDAWHALMHPYEPFVEILRRRAGQIPYAIATAKDLRSVEALLSAHGIADLFQPHLILDKETGAKKSAHLERLHGLLGLPYPEMTFVDDKVNHLDTVASLGVRCALAAWGYNGSREHDLAADRGYLVCTFDDVEDRLFGPA